MKVINKQLEQLREELNSLAAQRSVIVAELELDDDKQTRSVDEIQKDFDSIEKREKELKTQIEIRERVVAKKVEDGEATKINEREDEVPMNPYESLEYRNAFMAHVLEGKEIPAKYKRATTKTTDVGAVIPTTIMQRIIEDLRHHGNIWPRLTHTNFQGGLEIPLGNLKPVATWTAEGTTSARQKRDVSAAITFLYHKLQCKVSVTLEASVTTLAIFEQNLQESVVEAMIVAVEDAVFNGTGTGQPLGILNDTRVKASKKITIAAADIGKWETWAKAYAKLPLGKRVGVSTILHHETFEGDILGMVDDVGQPVARVNHGITGSEAYTLKGKEVVPVELYLPSFEEAEAGDVFGVICNLKDYVVNSNLQMGVRKYFDEETDEEVTKATLIADGKLADAQGVILLVKGA